MDKMIFGELSQRLLGSTAGCREDMYEPDEAGVHALFTGFRLDNAHGDDPHYNYGEMAVGIYKVDDDGGKHVEWFNLASLIALARIGARSIIDDLHSIDSVKKTYLFISQNDVSKTWSVITHSDAGSPYSLQTMQNKNNAIEWAERWKYDREVRFPNEHVHIVK